MTEAKKTIRTVSVRFNSGGHYAYLTDRDDLAEGDHVVVDSPSSGYTVVRVTNVNETRESIEKATKWIVDRVDVEGYERRLRVAEERKTIIAKLQREKARVLEANQFEELAKLSSEAAALVEALKALDA